MLDTVPAKELDRYAEEKTALVIDLRSRQEYLAGHIRGAVNVPNGRFGTNWPERNRTLVLYCDRGALSMVVARKLAEKGYQVKSVVGGFQAYRGAKMVRGSARG